MPEMHWLSGPAKPCVASVLCGGMCYTICCWNSPPCRVHDNPTCFEFPLSVIGAKPSVAIKLDQPAAVAAALEAGGSGKQGASAGGALRRGSDIGAAKGAKVVAGKAAKQVAELTVQFDRLLLRKKDTQAIIVSNTGVLPFKWRLAGADKLPADFKVYPASGELAARSDVRVVVEFNAITKKELSELVTLEVGCGPSANLHHPLHDNTLQTC